MTALFGECRTPGPLFAALSALDATADGPGPLWPALVAASAIPHASSPEVPATQPAAVSPPPVRPKGLLCPSCGSGELVVTHTRRPMPGAVIRYRRCACGTRVVTRETVVTEGPSAPPDEKQCH